VKAIWYQRLGGPEVLESVEAATPEPAAHEVLVEVEAAGVNFSDVGRRRGLYLDATPLPFVPGSEIVGRVCALGGAVTSLSVGDRVAGVTASRSGGYAEYCTIAADLVTRIDEGLDARRAVAVPNQGATALHVLETMGRLNLGDVVAVTAAAGGVGGLAIQLARHLGAQTVVALASSPHKLDHARRLGADVTVDVTTPGLRDQLRAATKGRGFDVVLDSVGGEVAAALFDALAPFGRLVSFGVASGVPLTVASHATMRRSLTVSGFHLDAVMAVPGWFQSTLDRLYALVASGTLRPHVGLELPLERAAETHAAVESRTTMGKIVLSIGGVAGSNEDTASHVTGRTG
jgi:NADPH2:quinone reductase